MHTFTAKVLKTATDNFTGTFTIGDVSQLLGICPPAQLLGDFIALEEAGHITREFPHYIYEVVK
jgi:hypothetical protein